MSKRLLKVAATLIGAVAFLAVAPASFVWVNQPEVPAELLE
ncbi:cyclic lactone autoinducer peptide [Cohnella nanjingensis]|uniref:Cyclic lactone autoinducer peptide n=1 Tax=Cohnella nanjingensis TaxID=1387779 RepID=A0A7X0RTK8_9BACL|nr:cyclic lactone autoinducer peptide [Cohnella nanjingensis]MBB6672150.1 cyclic lactone autoinducer peptide [Cohnella nanjingensis]